MSIRDELIANLKDKEYRDAFVSSQINIGLPYQIRALRGKMSQEELAALTGMKQPRISAIERPGYASLNLNTLKRVAAAFDVALTVRFVPFSELIEWAEHFSPDTFSVPAFDRDANLLRGSASAQVSPTVVHANAQATRASTAAGPSSNANEPLKGGAFSALTPPGPMRDHKFAQYTAPSNQKRMEARV